MNVFSIIARSSYTMFTICAGGGVYIYVTKGLGGDCFIGILGFSVACVFSFMLYKIGEWMVQLSAPYPYSSVEPDFQTASPGSGVIYIESIKDLLGCSEEESMIKDEPSESEGTLIPINIEEQPEEDNHETIEELKKYTLTIFKDFFPERELSTLVQIVDDFADGKIACASTRCTLSEIGGLKAKDIYHYGWNLWARLKPMDRHATCRFLKNAFPEILKDSSVDTIYRKMTVEDFGCTIQNIKLDERLC